MLRVAPQSRLFLFIAVVALCTMTAPGAQEGDRATPPFRVSPLRWPGQITVERVDAEARDLVAATVGDFGFRLVLERALPPGATLVIDPGKVTVHILTGLVTGTTYYVAVSAYDSDGNESWFSSTLTVVPS